MYRKKLIEVALPLAAINAESAREKSIRHGHPSTLHLWWARRPLAACRAVLFASLVTDPDDDPMFVGDEELAGMKRAELFNLLEELVKWENSNNAKVINRARAEIARSIAAEKVADGEWEREQDLSVVEPTEDDADSPAPDTYTPFQIKQLLATPEQVNHFLAHYAPPVLDPFAGGGSIPLEAQRLGLRAHASDLNPVPVLINKALIEIPPRFAGMPPVNPESRSEKKLTAREWRGAEGLAEDVRYYGKWMRDEAERRIGHLYPKVAITEAMATSRPDLQDYVGEELTVVAWLWARTVRSPNPAVHNAHVPLVKSFWLSKKKGKEAYIRPVIDTRNNSYTFEVHVGKPLDDFEPDKAGTVVRSGATCLLSQSPIPFDHVRSEGREGRIRTRLLAVVCEGTRGRLYLPPIEQHEQIAEDADPQDYPSTPLPEQALSFRVQVYGMDHHYKLFAPRQLLAMTTFSDLVSDARSRLIADAPANIGIDIEQYADAIATYLAFSQSKACNRNTSLCIWEQRMDRLVATFGRQSLPMVWDFAETNPFAGAGGDLYGTVKSLTEVLDNLPPAKTGTAIQCDARALSRVVDSPMISSDPPYYDNIGYADLSDFFYIWLRRSLASLLPSLFTTMLTPKETELIATPFRHEGNRERAKDYFETGLMDVVQQIRSNATARFPVTLFYAFKQSEVDPNEGDGNAASTGWETFLSGVTTRGYNITGTWPIRTEQPKGLRAFNQNVLASSIVLACRPRPNDAAMATRREFLEAMRSELPGAIRNLQHGNIAPVDLAQASIGPGMAVFSRYSKVVNSDGSNMTVREALQLINQVLDEVLSEQEGDFDQYTRWAVKWFEQFAHDDGPFGDAETLAKATAVSVNGLVEAGIAHSGAGKARLLKRDELASNWDPASDERLTIWEVTQYLIRGLEADGETGAARLLRKVGQGHGETARELAYRLYTTCERKRWADLARSYNGLVVAWPEIVKLSREMPAPETQTELF